MLRFVALLFMALGSACWAQEAASTSGDSAGFALVGLAKVDGVTYACLVDLQKNEHFVLSERMPQHGLTLVSVSPLDSSVLSIVVRQGDNLVRLGLGHDPRPDTGLTEVSTAGPRSSNVPSPPAGRSLPLIFRVVPPDTKALDPTQKEALSRLRQSFIDEVGGNNPSSPGYSRVWRHAQRETDESMRTLLGDDVYSRYQAEAQGAGSGG